MKMKYKLIEILEKYYNILNNQCTFNIIFLRKISQKTNMLIKKGESKKKSKKILIIINHLFIQNY